MINLFNKVKNKDNNNNNNNENNITNQTNLKEEEYTEMIAEAQKLQNQWIDENIEELREWRNEKEYFEKYILEEAIKNKATDIHFEPEYLEIEKNWQKIKKWLVVVRFRIKGDLIFVKTIPIEFYTLILNYIKDYFKMKVGEFNRQQDWSWTVVINEKRYRLRITIIPTVYQYDEFGFLAFWNKPVEKVVIRILSNKLFDINELWLWPYKDYLIQITSSTWIFLVTGPTSHGKTTTLNSLLDHLRKIYPKQSFNSVEEPIEIIISWKKDKKWYIPGITPIEINNFISKKDVQKFLLRANPNFINIGELRINNDFDFAKNLAETWHTVLWTVHVDYVAKLKERLIAEWINYDSFIMSVTWLLSQRLLKVPYKVISIYNFLKNKDKYLNSAFWNIYQSFLERFNTVLSKYIFRILIRPNWLGQKFYKNENEKVKKFLYLIQLYFKWNDKYKPKDPEILLLLKQFIIRNIYIQDYLLNEDELKEIQKIYSDLEISQLNVPIKRIYPVFELADLSDPKIANYFQTEPLKILNDESVNFISMAQDAFIKQLIYWKEGFNINQDIIVFDLLNDLVYQWLFRHKYL